MSRASGSLSTLPPARDAPHGGPACCAQGQPPRPAHLRPARMGPRCRNASGVSNEVLCPFPSTGYLVAQPEGIFSLGQAEGAGKADGEAPTRSGPGERVPGQSGRGKGTWWASQSLASGACPGALLRKPRLGDKTRVGWNEPCNTHMMPHLPPLCSPLFLGFRGGPCSSLHPISTFQHLG